jgi:hypothetical protein
MVKVFFFAKRNFGWKEKLCTDGAPATLGNTSGFATLVKKEAPHFVTDVHWQQSLFQHS